MKCPHCNKRIVDGEKNNWQFEKAYKNCEFYDNTNFILECPFCNKKYRLRVKKTIKIDFENVEKVDSREIADFSSF